MVMPAELVPPRGRRRVPAGTSLPRRPRVVTGGSLCLESGGTHSTSRVRLDCPHVVTGREAVFEKWRHWLARLVFASIVLVQSLVGRLCLGSGGTGQHVSCSPRSSSRGHWSGGCVWKAEALASTSRVRLDRPRAVTGREAVFGKRRHWPACLVFVSIILARSLIGRLCLESGCTGQHV
jgi:hypothetical protein